MKIKHSSINFTTLVLLFSPWSDASVGVLAAKNKHREKGGGGEQGLFTEEAPTHANESRKEVIEEGNVFDTHVEEEVIIENHVDINTYEGLRKVEKKGISKRVSFWIFYLLSPFFQFSIRTHSFQTLNHQPYLHYTI